MTALNDGSKLNSNIEEVSDGYMTQEDGLWIDRLFTAKPMLPGQSERIMELRAMAHALCRSIARLCPPSTERATAIATIDNAILVAEAAIRRNEVAYTGRSTPGTQAGL